VCCLRETELVCDGAFVLLLIRCTDMRTWKSYPVTTRGTAVCVGLSARRSSEMSAEGDGRTNIVVDYRHLTGLCTV
jgi:hypothetical protein